MRSLDSAEIAAIEARRVAIIDLVWLVCRDRTTGDPEEFGFHSDVGTITVDVLDAVTNTVETRTFTGSGTLLDIGVITLTSTLDIRPVDVSLSSLHPLVESALREFEPRAAPVQIYRLYIDPDTRLAISTAKPRFVGFVDETPIKTAAIGGKSSSSLRLVSRTREMTRGNPSVRSHEDQQRRHVGDTFFKDVDVVGDWELFWGKTKGKASQSTQAVKGGLFARIRARIQARRARLGL